MHFNLSGDLLVLLCDNMLFHRMLLLTHRHQDPTVTSKFAVPGRPGDLLVLNVIMKSIPSPTQRRVTVGQQQPLAGKGNRVSLRPRFPSSLQQQRRQRRRRPRGSTESFAFRLAGDPHMAGPAGEEISRQMAGGMRREGPF
jgi:hypothetical protein